ncbi:hypothetical protein DTO207G8_9156 [Paecilomyces variotii]|nr:hypothetical protein DTO207G8_9156 [Paecilomyces variotii]
MTTLFTLPITSTGGSFVCSNPLSSKEGEETEKNIYLLTFASPPDNRLTTDFVEAFLLALDIIEHRYPKGVVITTSGIGKFFSNGLDLAAIASQPDFLDGYLWKLFRRLLTYPMPTIALINGHAFAGGLMLAMFHDYRVQNPSRGFVCLNEIEFGVTLQAPMMSIFREKISPTTFRTLVLEGKRFPGPEALQAGIVDVVGGLEETLKFIKDRKLVLKPNSGIWGSMKEEMYRESLAILDSHQANLKWRDNVEEQKTAQAEKAKAAVQKWEKSQGKAKL